MTEYGPVAETTGCNKHHIKIKHRTNAHEIMLLQLTKLRNSINFNDYEIA
jgi:hypothetical protein